MTTPRRTNASAMRAGFQHQNSMIVGRHPRNHVSIRFLEDVDQQMPMRGITCIHQRTITDLAGAMSPLQIPAPQRRRISQRDRMNMTQNVGR